MLEEIINTGQYSRKLMCRKKMNDMKYFLSWLEKVMKAYNGEARAIFYYSGHGMPDDTNKQSFLLPVDGHSTSPESGLSTETLYSLLGSLQSTETMVFLDACFSGASRDGGMMQSSRGVAITPRKNTVSGNMVVFSATKENETAYPYRDKNHGMFTCGKSMKAAMHGAIYTEEMAQTTYYAKALGVYEPMPEEADKKMKELIAADQAV